MSGMQDPLHEESDPDTWWTTVNVAEAIPGVPTPLGWTFWTQSMEYATQWSFHDIGVLPRRSIDLTPPMRDRFAAVFHGHVATNLDLLERFAQAMPGTSPEAFEEQFFGEVRPGLVRGQANRRRYPFVASKLPVAAALLPRRLARLRAESDAFWRATVRDALDDAAARRLLAQARLRFRRVVRRHGLATLFAQACYEQVARLATEVGTPGLETSIVSGQGNLEEAAIAADLWDVAHHGLSLEVFLDRHGYHGPSEGELSSRTWREAPQPLEALLGSYRQMPVDADPRAAEARRAEERRVAERRVLATLGPVARRRALLVFRMARRYVPLREVGKATFLQVLDVVRHCARIIGSALARQGVLAEPEDVFFLTIDELAGSVPRDARELVAFRRERREGYLSFRIPELFQGTPQALPLEARSSASVGHVVEGAAVAPGVVEGTVRLVLDPAECEPLQPGEVLVTRTTDPSWVSMFLVAGALVIDIGGALSHGAIVARELGIPCVIGTKVGTSLLSTGDRVRVDGGAGRVEVLARVADAGPETATVPPAPTEDGRR